MNQQQPIHRRRLTRAEIRRRRRNRAIRRIAGLTLVVCVAVGGVSFLLSRRKAPVPTADAAGSAANSAASSLPSAAPSSKAESSAMSGAAAESVESRDNLLGLTAAEAKAMLADPLMILVNHTNKMPENYTFETAECGSKTAVNKTPADRGLQCLSGAAEGCCCGKCDRLDAERLPQRVLPDQPLREKDQLL